jgi:Histidine kinase
MPNADTAPLKPPPSVAIDDRRVVLMGSIGFGLGVPWLTGLYGPLGPGDASFWLGMLGFIALAAAIWLGNRWLLFKQREHFHWFDNPFRKLAMLVTANVLYTAPVSALGIWAWFRISGQAIDSAAIEVVVLTNVICVLFVTHAYETVFLIRERESDLTRVERLERMRSQAELAALKAQIDPHFLFNSLNTLGHLIVRDPPRGREFCDLLAEVYRYVLASRDRDLVPLADELAFVRNYHRLLVLRFGDAVQLDLADALRASDPAGLVPPLALQTLLENAVKHNRTGNDQPLVVQMQLDGDSLRVSNLLQSRSSSRPSSGLGLKNLDERCRMLTGRALGIRADGPRFDVRVPVVMQ